MTRTTERQGKLLIEQKRWMRFGAMQFTVSQLVLLLLLPCHLHFSLPINILLYNSRFGTVQSVLAEFTAAKFPQFRKILFHLLLIPGRRDYLFKCLNDEYTM